MKTEPRIIKNAIRCKLCGTVIESKHRHDFVGHACDTDDKAIYVDGGREYLRRCGNPEYYEDVSEYDTE
jgi:hypothetical protein